MSLTVHDILGTIEGLQRYASALAQAAKGTIHDTEEHGMGVLTDPQALAEIAVWMNDAASELRELVPDYPVQLSEDRRRTKTLVRIVSYDEGNVGMILPGWNPDMLVCRKVPELDELLSASSDTTFPLRVHAWVNTQTDTEETLEFSDWELP